MSKKVNEPAPQEELSQTLQEEAIGDVPAQVPDDDVTDVDVVEDLIIVKTVPGPSKKRTRVSKKDVKDYPFTDDQVRDIVDFVKTHPELYDKRHKNWLNPAGKLSLWMELARHFHDCTHMQVKKFVEKKRTDFGKIEKREQKSGSAARPRTQREQKVVDDWGFLAGHIAHETTNPSEDFGTRDRYDPESSSPESGLSAHSIARRKRKKERQEDDLSSTRSTKGSPERSAIEQLLHTAQLLSTQKPPLDGPAADVRKFVEYMYSRLMKVSPMHHAMLFAKINYMISVMEEPVMGVSAIREPKRVMDSVAMPVGVPGPSQQQWQPPATPTVAPGPPPPPPLYQQTQYHQAQYAPTQYLHPQYPPHQQQYQHPQPQYQQSQHSEQQQVSTPAMLEQLLTYAASPSKSRLQPLKTRSPAKKVMSMSPLLDTPKGFQTEDIDE